MTNFKEFLLSILTDERIKNNLKQKIVRFNTKILLTYVKNLYYNGHNPIWRNFYLLLGGRKR